METRTKMTTACTYDLSEEKRFWLYWMTWRQG